MIIPIEQRPHSATPRIVDIINLSSSADTLLKSRVWSLRQSGFDNRIICMDGPYVQKLRDIGIPVFTAPLPRGHNPVKVVASLIRIALYLRREQIDLVHTHCSVAGFIGRLAARLAGVPVVIQTVHGFHFHDRSPRWERAIYVALEKFAGLFTDTLLSQNRHDLELAARYGIVPRDRMRYIGNGIQLDQFRRPNGRPSVRGPLTITCVARLEPVKNHRMLFEATRILKQRGHEFRLRLIGGGGLRASHEALCVKLGIADRVTFLGYRDDMADLLAETDISVLTSVKEGIPRALLESMAMGIPVVATRVNGSREVVREGETGFLVELGDSAALANALERLIVDSNLRATIGQRAGEVAQSEYDETPIVESLRTIYRDHLAKRGVVDRVSVPLRAGR
jgi:glycosyltransferase involved in cell wall biosynthesis